MAGPLFYDRVLETSTTTGTGTYTLAGAVTGYQSFAAVGNSNTCHYVAFEVDASGNPSGSWEVGVGTYTTSGTTLARTEVIASTNSNNAVSWSAGTRRIALTTPASIAIPSINAPGGRLSLTTAVPVTTSDVTAAGTLRYVPYVHNRIEVWDGFCWRRKTFSEMSLSLTLTADKNYDVFVDDDAATLSLSAAWTNDTTRADALGTQDSVTVLNSDKTKLWLGTIRASGTNTTEDSAAKRFVWNAYNRVLRTMRVIETTDSWNYSTNTIRQARATATNQLAYVVGAAVDSVNAHLEIGLANNSTTTNRTISVGIGVDSTTTIAGGSGGAGTCNSTFYAAPRAQYDGIPGLGYHFLAWLEVGAGTDTQTWFGDAGAPTLYQSQISGSLLA
jgi:hypothetical protein